MQLSQRRERLLARLGSGRSRAREEQVLVEGVRAVSEALSAGAAASFAVVSPRLESTELGRVLAESLRTSATGLDVVRLDDDALTRLAATGHPQGVLLVCAEPLSSPGDALHAAARVLVLDAIQDPGNVGTLVRSAVAFGFDAVVALDGTADPWGSKAVRASAGTAFRLPLVRAEAEDVLAVAADEEITVLVASSEGRPASEVWSGSDGFALVLGNEGAGIRPEFRARADATIAVEMRGGTESLNVGIAGSILMHDLTRLAAGAG